MATQKDIAIKLGVSPSLVSRALSGSAAEIGARPETVQRIRELAIRLHYRPSAAALALRGTPTKMLGVIIKNFNDPFFGQLIGELQQLASSKEYSIVLAGCIPRDSQRVDFGSLLKYRLDGVVVAGSDFAPEGLEAFSTQGIPLVQIGAGSSHLRINRVTMDEQLGIRQLIDYLGKLGHRDIGYIGDDSALCVRREQLIREALRNSGLTERPNALARVLGNKPNTGYRAMRKLLARCRGLLPTAVIGADDSIAQAGLRALYEQSISVPGEVSLAGIDDIPSAQLMIPALTTLRQPIKELIREAFHLLTSASRLRNETVGAEIFVAPELIIRESCKSPRHRQRSHE